MELGGSSNKAGVTLDKQRQQQQQNITLSQNTLNNAPALGEGDSLPTSYGYGVNDHVYHAFNPEINNNNNNSNKSDMLSLDAKERISARRSLLIKELQECEQLLTHLHYSNSDRNDSLVRRISEIHKRLDELKEKRIQDHLDRQASIDSQLEELEKVKPLLFIIGIGYL
jgi:hypothetical protein